MSAPLEAARRAAGSRALVLCGAACVLSGLVAWGFYEHAASVSIRRAPALALYVPVALPGLQAAPPPPSVMAPALAASPGAQMPGAPAVVPAASPAGTMMMPMTMMEAPGAQQMPIGQPSMDSSPPFLPPAAEPSKTETLMGPVQLLFWGVAASVAIAMTVTRKEIIDRLQNLGGDSVEGGAASLRPSVTTIASAAEDSLELGMLPARAGAPTMMADAGVADGKLSRRATLSSFASAAAAAALGSLAPTAARADEAEVVAEVAPAAPAPPPKPAPPPRPVTTDFKLKKDYPADAKAMLTNMRAATALTRGAPGMEDIVKNTRSEMNDFVAFYRRQPKVAGMPSFSTLYTAINTLSGHYASYGNKYPVPEKRRTRLEQQYKEIDRALARGK